MLIPKEPQFNFANAPWDIMKLKLPFIASDISDAKGRDRYRETDGGKTQGFGIASEPNNGDEANIPSTGTPLDYLKEVIWDDTLAQDRFFCYCDAKLIDQVRDAAAKVYLSRNSVPAYFIPGRPPVGNRSSSARRMCS